ncbi:MAG: hypothetical protein GY914_07780 [Prochlorococcus sp.]|nr:hypothetical protein [Prochlorococcus sp.]CAI8176935.1 MAG: Uncharacterised protein [Prochlorococcus marinus str. MIT 9215]
MPKKRRKLSKELEKEISLAKKKVEFITAKINDIEEEDIQTEYRQAFDQINAACLFIEAEYIANGVTEESEGGLVLYKGLLERFESEYEL